MSKDNFGEKTINGLPSASIEYIKYQNVTSQFVEPLELRTEPLTGPTTNPDPDPAALRELTGETACWLNHKR